MKHIIWSNRDLDIEDYKDDYMECCDITEEDYDEDDCYNWMYEDNDLQLDDERINLNVDVGGKILAIVDLGLWNGRHSGYKIIESSNLRDILYSECDYVEWYDDGHNVKATMSHHDGTNYVEYRTIREDRNIDNLLDDIYAGKEISRSKLNYYTKSLHKYMTEIYGW